MILDRELAGRGGELDGDDELDARLKRAFAERDEELRRISAQAVAPEWPQIRDGFRATMAQRRKGRPTAWLVGGALAAAILTAVVVVRGSTGTEGLPVGHGPAGPLGPELGAEPGQDGGEVADTPIERLEADGQRLRLRIDNEALISGYYTVRIRSLNGDLLAQTDRHDAPIWVMEDAALILEQPAILVEVSTWIDWNDGEEPEPGASWRERVPLD